MFKFKNKKNIELLSNIEDILNKNKISYNVTEGSSNTYIIELGSIITGYIHINNKDISYKDITINSDVFVACLDNYINTSIIIYNEYIVRPHNLHFIFNFMSLFLEKSSTLSDDDLRDRLYKLYKNDILNISNSILISFPSGRTSVIKNKE